MYGNDESRPLKTPNTFHQSDHIQWVRIEWKANITGFVDMSATLMKIIHPFILIFVPHLEFNCPIGIGGWPGSAGANGPLAGNVTSCRRQITVNHNGWGESGQGQLGMQGTWPTTMASAKIFWRNWKRMDRSEWVSAGMNLMHSLRWKVLSNQLLGKCGRWGSCCGNVVVNILVKISILSKIVPLKFSLQNWCHQHHYSHYLDCCSALVWITKLFTKLAISPLLWMPIWRRCSASIKE